MEQVAIRDRRSRGRYCRDGDVSAETVYAALDLGTNNCRLLMATPWGEGFRVVEAFSRTTRLGEGLANSGHLCEGAILRTLAALRQCAIRLERRGVRRVRAVATEACRRAANCNSFLDRVRRDTGIRMEIISAEEEACLALTGCSPLLDRDLPHALVFDIGGGSTELVHVQTGDHFGCDEVKEVASLPVGVVTLAEELGEALYRPEGYAQTVDALVAMLRPFDRASGLARLVASNSLQMIGTSGTVTTLAGVHLDLPRYDRSQVDGLVMDFAALGAVSRRLVSASPSERAAHPCIGCGRADLVVAGCAILEAICRLWPVGRLRVADRGVREGVLLSMMRADRNIAAQ